MLECFSDIVCLVYLLIISESVDLMDDDTLNMRNWGGYYEPTFKGHLGLQLMSSMTEHRDAKPFMSGRSPAPVMVGANGAFHHPRDSVLPQAPVHMDYVRNNSWMNHRDKFYNTMPTNLNYAVLPESSAPHTMPILQPSEAARDDNLNRVEEPAVKSEGAQSKKRGAGAPKSPKAKKTKKPKETNSAPVQRTKPAKKSVDFVINGIDLDISTIPIPVCSCTGTPQQCYRWGCGGWQSACCTTNVSMYPLPMSTKRRGARIAGRKMSQGAFKKVLEKLAAEGYNFANPIDLKTHWAKHGTNKFVTIR